MTMKPTIIRSTKATESFIKDKKVRDILKTKDWPFGLALVKKTTNDIRAGYDKESDVVYYVLKGKSTCTLNGKKYKVKQGDFIVSPKGTVYKNLKGTTLLAISYPVYDREKRVYVE
ncbi:MAG: cupin domain-containing protein [Candidatus Micrarchaeaceae archaeon]|jgi:mannose-6-phosphate isomerase-like protein (cupin superfamily)|nr:cupin domain-containing protein [Candidatus Micrarchaeota archaeon]